jgi:uncharacterized damage-inducible protein DinB
MDVREWFAMSRSHIDYRVERLCQNLNEEQLRVSPGENFNSIVWLLWHMARCEDIMVNTVLRNVPEVLDRGDWLARLSVNTRHIGTGDTYEEMQVFSRQVDVSALRAYWNSVGQETQQWVAQVDVESLDGNITAEEAQRAKELGAFGPRAEDMQSLWTDGGRGFFLTWLAIGHNHSHIGEGWVIHSLVE